MAISIAIWALETLRATVTGEKWFDREESEDEKVETDELDGDCCYGE